MNMHVGLLMVAVVACGQPEARKDYFGTTVAPPRELAKLRPGMTEAEALAAVPDIRKDAVLNVPSGAEDVELVGIPDDHGVIAHVIARVHPPLASQLRVQLETGWGKPAAPDQWIGAAWRADVHSRGSIVEIEFSPTGSGPPAGR